MKDKKLFEDFPPVTTKEWLDRITGDLKGADFNRKLVWKTNEGFDVMPFYRQEDLDGIKLNSAAFQKPDNHWLIRQNIIVCDYSEANRKALSLQGRGIDSVGFMIKDPASINEENFRILLKDVDPRTLELNFLSEGMAREAVSFLKSIYTEGDQENSLVRGCFEADPLSRLMANGTLCIPEEKGFDYLASLTRDTLTLAGFRNIQVHGCGFKDAGSDSVREVGFSLAMAVEYLDQLTTRGIDPQEIAGKIRFCFGTGPDYFIEIAKLRAARLLWNVILKKYIPDQNQLPVMRIHSVTTNWNCTVYDSYVNLLRTQTETMSAVLGGADSVTVNPYDAAFSAPGDFSERIARNQQLILRDEAFFEKVADPAAGSYYIEKLTEAISEGSWKLFLKVEEAGGFLASLKSGFIQEEIARIASKRRDDISGRREVLVGTNKYANLKERIPAGKFPNPYRSDNSRNSDPEITPVKPRRGSEELEKIRIAVDRAAHRPVVFLLATGNQVFARARVQFSSGFFGCAGYHIIETEVYGNVQDGMRAALEAKADLIVICSSDQEYRTVAPEVFRGVSGKSIVVVAGNPDSMEELKAAGITNFVSVRSDLCGTLKYYNTILGIS